MTILPSLILASASPRRANLLTQLGLEFRIEPSHMPEEVLPGERPEGHAERLSREKALEVWAGNRTSLVVAGDTVVVLDGEILGKPSDQEHAETMLLALSGRTHIVVSGLALAIPEGELYSGTESTEVTFRHFGLDEARAYAATGEPMDKAGGTRPGPMPRRGNPWTRPEPMGSRGSGVRWSAGSEVITTPSSVSQSPFFSSFFAGPATGTSSGY